MKKKAKKDVSEQTDTPKSQYYFNKINRDSLAQLKEDVIFAIKALDTLAFGVNMFSELKEQENYEISTQLFVLALEELHTLIDEAPLVISGDPNER